VDLQPGQLPGADGPARGVVAGLATLVPPGCARGSAQVRPRRRATCSGSGGWEGPDRSPLSQGAVGGLFAAQAGGSAERPQVPGKAGEAPYALWRDQATGGDSERGR